MIIPVTANHFENNREAQSSCFNGQNEENNLESVSDIDLITNKNNIRQASNMKVSEIEQFQSVRSDQPNNKAISNDFRANAFMPRVNQWPSDNRESL